MLFFYLCCYLAKTVLVFLSYGQLAQAFNLPNLNYLQVLMILTFLLIIRLTLVDNYADVSAFKSLSDTEKINLCLNSVLITAFLALFCCFLKLIL